MAPILPNPFAWKSNANNKYLRLDEKSSEGILKFTGEDPNYIFEAEDASGYVKIKNTENKLYLIGVPSENSTKWLIQNTALTTPNETDDEDSTSFELVNPESTNNTAVFRLRHVKSKLYVRLDGSDAVLYAVSHDPDLHKKDLFTAIGKP